jgi:hypothetical protein
MSDEKPVVAVTAEGNRPDATLAAVEEVGAHTWCVQAEEAEYTSDASVVDPKQEVAGRGETSRGLSAYLASLAADLGWRVAPDWSPVRRDPARCDRDIVRLPDTNARRLAEMTIGGASPLELRDSPNEQGPVANLKSYEQPLDWCWLVQAPALGSQSLSESLAAVRNLRGCHRRLGLCPPA